MRFTQRNIFYLRASRNVVLQTFLYVDPRHLKWMNQPLTSEEENTNQESDNDGVVDQEAQTIGDEVWAKALGGLRYNIMPKLHNESDGEVLSSTNKKGKVEVHLEPNFQMAYFFREVKGKHAVLLKVSEAEQSLASCIEDLFERANSYRLPKNICLHHHYPPHRKKTPLRG